MLLGYLEFHIEQGPVLEKLNLPLAAVEAIAGQSRLEFTFLGHANHAGTTPMHLRHDAIAGAAEWISTVERVAQEIPGLVATVGRIEAKPGATNVIAGEAKLTLDVRHSSDEIRTARRRRSHSSGPGNRGAPWIISAGEQLIKPARSRDGSVSHRGDRTRNRQDRLQAASDGEWRRSRCHDPGGESSERNDFSADSGRDQPRSGRIGLAPNDVEKAIVCGLHLLDQLASSPEFYKRTNRA